MIKPIITAVIAAKELPGSNVLETDFFITWMNKIGYFSTAVFSPSMLIRPIAIV
jgi:hypothetical protein